MTEEDTIGVLKSPMIRPSIHGGYYYFVPLPQSTIGYIFCVGNIYDIIKNKTHQGELFTDWLNTTPVDMRIMYAYVNKCDIYATHITVTYPEPGDWWEWENDKS